MKALKPVLLGVAAVALLLVLLSFAIEALESIRLWILLVGAAVLSFVPNSKVVRAAFGTALFAVLILSLIQLIGMPIS